MQANSAPSLRKGAPSPPSRASQVHGIQQRATLRRLLPCTVATATYAARGLASWAIVRNLVGPLGGKSPAAMPSASSTSTRSWFRYPRLSAGPGSCTFGGRAGPGGASWEIAYSGATRGWVIRFGCGIAGKLPGCRGLTNERQYSGLPLPLKLTGHRQATPPKGRGLPVIATVTYAAP